LISLDAENFAGAGLGQRGNETDLPKGGDGTEFVADHLDELFVDHLHVLLSIRLEHNEAHGYLS